MLGLKVNTTTFSSALVKRQKEKKWKEKQTNKNYKKKTLLFPNFLGSFYRSLWGRNSILSKRFPEQSTNFISIWKGEKGESFKDYQRRGHLKGNLHSNTELLILMKMSAINKQIGGGTRHSLEY